MKKIKFKKISKKQIVKGSLITTTLGGIATGIGVPVSNAINNKNKIIEKIDLNKTVYQDADGKKWTYKELIQKYDDIEKETDESIITDFMKSTSYYLYKEEQKHSFEKQKRKFKYNWFIKDKDKDKLEKKSNKSKKEVDDLKELKKELTKIENKINDLIKLQKSIDDINYNSSDFKEKYPEILPSVKSLENKQGKIYDDTKKAFVENFKTKEEGEKEWIDQRKNIYNNATSKKKAISNLIFKTIKEDSLKSYKLSVNQEYIVEMENAKYKEEANDIFPFLNGLSSKFNFNSELDKNKKLYFIGTESNDKDKVKVDLTENSEIINILHDKKMTKMSHILIGAKPNEKGTSLNWEIKKDTIKKLFKEYKGKKWMIDLLDEDLFKDANKSNTDFFIENISEDPSSAKAKGSLGTDSMMKLLEDKVPGFVLGLIDGYDDSEDSSEGINLLNNLKDKLKEFIWGTKIANAYPKSRKGQKEMTEYIDAMPEKDFNEGVGQIFKDAFNYGDTGAKISYDLGNKTYLTISKFGIHIINVNPYSTKKNISDSFEKDLKLVAKEQDTSKSEIKYESLLKNINTDDKVIKRLLKQNEYISFLKTGYEKDENVKNNSDLEDYYENKNKKTWDEIKKDVETKIKNIEKTESIKSMNKIWFSSKLGKILNDKRIDKSYESKASTRVQYIYEKALKLTGLKGDA